MNFVLNKSIAFLLLHVKVIMCDTTAELGNNANKVEAIKKERFFLYSQLFEEATWRRKISFDEAY